MKFTYQVDLDITPATEFLPLVESDVVAEKANFEEELSKFVGVHGTVFTKITLTETKPVV